MSDRTLVLTEKQVNQKTQRIARQILEECYDQGEVYFVGIAERGYKVAQNISEILKDISKLDIQLSSLKIDKDDPWKFTPELDPEVDLAGKTVILVDDVLNSGFTLIHAVKFLLQHDIKLLRTVVLVDRRHRRFPVRADYVGLTLSTTLQEHIAVDMQSNEVYLT